MWSYYKSYHQENGVTRTAEGLANYDIKTNGWKETKKGSIEIGNKNVVLMKSATPTLKQATHATRVSPGFDVLLSRLKFSAREALAKPVLI